MPPYLFGGHTFSDPSDSVFSFHFYCCDKILQQNNFREESFVFSFNSMLQGSQSKNLKQLVNFHPQYRIEKNKCVHVCQLWAYSRAYTVQNSLPENGAACTVLDPPNLLNVIKTIYHRHANRLSQPRQLLLELFSQDDPTLCQIDKTYPNNKIRSHLSKVLDNSILGDLTLMRR